VQHLGLAQTSEQSAGREVAYVSQPIRLSRTPSKIVAHPPELGEHTDAILAEYGLDQATIDDLRARQVI
jgi:formyl-CoA transferase